MKYHIWTEGCQMNVADSQRVGSSLEHLGYSLTENPEEADVIVLNTCVVRQSAEDKAIGRVSSFKKLKEKNPNLTINLMGCLVGVRGAEKLKAKLPYVDVFSPPSDPGPLISHLTQGEVQSLEDAETTRRFLMMDEELKLPVAEQGKTVSVHVPIVYGCSHACTFCIIPYKRGVERSRPVGDIVAEIRSLAKQGVKEITLLGQIVDRYGKDIPDGPNLAALLRIIHEVEGIERIRFLTSHPNYFGDELIDTIAELPRIMPHIELPIQAGDDTVLENMKRGYTQGQFRDLVEKIRKQIPDCSIATDIIVGFPGETEEQFMETYRVLSDLKLDVAHLARYSVREGTVATRRMVDDVTDEEKMRRFRMLEDLQEGIVGEINAKYLGQTVDVLFEDKVKGRWRGRTPTNKLVFVESEDDLRGKVLPVTVTWTGPWSMQANLVKQPELISL
ncbi:MAG: tRNA (N6-isopentenyl adenosine(37)-C2)-methylthiotransferase MiaB [Anaerolineales bacterium]|nr:tRNA (N6-isopentenyl adenosine(37)-C2)-methylthiotransferase MiaB [Anaerolineales bacterium]MCB9111564.1 tRNA (N6-isopentenyl adenosine(37)-C2)-methylthiotransferase MiaB [Anaerolineales bacterium]